MKRRNAIKTAALMMGYGLTASTVAGVMSGCKTDVTTPEAIWKPSFFNADQMDLLKVVTEQILPATDTPGANDVFVHRFIDQMLSNCYTPKVQKRFVDGLNKFSADCQQEFKKTFADCTDEERNTLLTRYDQEAHAMRKKLGLEYKEEKKKFWEEAATVKSRGTTYQRTERAPFFSKLKELTMVGYFNSEKVGEEVLNYLPIPGDYWGCIDLPENGRSWSL